MADPSPQAPNITVADLAVFAAFKKAIEALKTPEMVKLFVTSFLLVGNWISVVLSLPFIVLVAVAGVNTCSSNCMSATKAFSIITGLWVLAYWLVLGVACSTTAVGWQAVLPHITFTIYFMMSVIAYALQFSLLGKIAVGLLGLTLLTLVILSLTIPVICIRRVVSAGDSVNQVIKDLQDKYGTFSNFWSDPAASIGNVLTGLIRPLFESSRPKVTA